GLVACDEPSPERLLDAGIHLATLRTRTFARLAGLTTPTAQEELPVPTQPVEPEVVRWISGAVRIAQSRDEYGREVVPDDLVQVVQDARQHVHPLHDLLHDVIDLFDPGNQLPAGSSGTPSQGVLIPVESDAQPSTDVGDRIFKAIKSAHKTA